MVELKKYIKDELFPQHKIAPKKLQLMVDQKKYKNYYNYAVGALAVEVRKFNSYTRDIYFRLGFQ